MTIEIVKLNTNADEFSLWIDEDQGFREEDLLDALKALEVISQKTESYSFGPAERTEEVRTCKGVFNIHYAFDELPGVTIYSDWKELMETILELILASGKYHERPQKDI